MNIAIIGAGNVGSALGKRWANVGHQIKFGVRDIKKSEVVALLREIGNSGKIRVDCTNPLKSDFSGLTIGFETSGGEQVAQWARGAPVVKCFNTTSAGNMAQPDYGGQRLAMFLCGDDAAAKTVVASLAEQIGFQPADAGPLRVARLLEPLAMLWIQLGYAQGWGTDFGFCIARR